MFGVWYALYKRGDIMKIKIRSRDNIEEIAKNPFPERTALISISDWGYEFAELKNKPEFLLQLAFDDVDNDVFIDELGRKPTKSERQRIEHKYHMLTDKQAKQIAEFYMQIADKADILVCQCEHGQSRSAAIASAILEYRNGDGIRVFVDDRYYPNKTIFKKVLKYLKKEGI